VQSIYPLLDVAAASKAEQRFVKLLLLGSGDSGKTTLRKQMRSLYGTGFSEAERKATIPVIFGNIVEGCAAILTAMAELGEVCYIYIYICVESVYYF